MRRHVNGWTVLTTEAAWKRWVKKNCLFNEGPTPPRLPCLARSLIDSREDGHGDYLTIPELNEMRSVLLGWISKL